MPELFRRSGYQTTLIGKISHTADGLVYDYGGKGDGRDEMPLAWSEKITPLGAWKRGWGIFFAYPNGKHREDGGGHKDLMDFTAENDEDLPDGQMANTAIQRLKQFRNSDTTFFMGLGFFKPHLPFVAPKQDWDSVLIRDVPSPPNPQKVDSPHWHKSGEFYKYDSPLKKTWPMSEVDTLTAKASKMRRSAIGRTRSQFARPLIDWWLAVRKTVRRFRPNSTTFGRLRTPFTTSQISSRKS